MGIRSLFRYTEGAGGCADTTAEFTADTSILYGIEDTEKIPLFSACDYRAYVSLIYDDANGGERQETWFKKVSNAALAIQRKLNHGKTAAVPKEYADCIRIEEQSGKPVVMVTTNQVQEKGGRKGFYTLASSKAMKAREANEIYVLRNSSEEQFSMVKSQLGYDTTGTHYTEGIKAGDRNFISHCGSYWSNTMVFKVFL